MLKHFKDVQVNNYNVNGFRIGTSKTPFYLCCDAEVVDTKITKDPKEVTCKRCLAIMKRFVKHFGGDWRKKND